MLIFTGLIIAPRAQAELVLGATYSQGNLMVDELVIVEAVFSWRQDEGTYNFSAPEWSLDNLVFYGDTRSEAGYLGPDGKPWQRVTLRYEFKPIVTGKAVIKFIRFTYLNVATQESGHATVVRQIEYQIRKRRDYWLMLTDMLCLMSGSLFAGSLLILFHTKCSAQKVLAEKKVKEDCEYAAVPVKIEKAQGSQKEQAFEWGNQFKLFLVDHYGLSKAFLTEQEAVDLLSRTPDISAAEAKKVEALSDRLSSVKFSSKDLDKASFERLKKDLLAFIRSRIGPSPVSRMSSGGDMQ